MFVPNNGTWTEQQKLIGSDGLAGDRFGRVVTVLDDSVFVGANWVDSKKGILT